MNLLTIVFKNIWHKKIRTGLTILGVGVSIAAFVSLMGSANNLEKMLKEAYKARGTDLIVMEKGIVDFLSSRIDQAYLYKIKQIPAVLDVSPILIDFYTFKLKKYILVYGWDINSYLFDELKVEGRYVQNQDEVLLGSMAAKKLDKKTGDTIKIKGVRFSVVGIFQSKSFLEETAVIISLKQFQKIKKVTDQVTSFNIKVRRVEPPEGAGAYVNIAKTIEDVQAEIVNSFPDLEVKNVQGFVSTYTPLLMVLNYTWAISAIAFIIVVLGIVNTMTTSVLEQTREIGILLAMGWRNIKIVVLILYESVLLGFLGGIAGVVMGYGIMEILASRPHLQGIMEVNFDIPFMFKAVIISLCLGFLSGIYPASKAISIEPIRVLRYEG